MLEELISKKMGDGSQKSAILYIAQCLFKSEVQGHIIHLQAVGKSYATHMALGEFYLSLPELRDELVEKYQGKYGILTGYANIEVKDNLEPIPFVQGELKNIEMYRKSITDGYLQQLTDNIIEQFSQTLYKLINLH